jgi:hypothetical protein
MSNNFRVSAWNSSVCFEAESTENLRNELTNVEVKEFATTDLQNSYKNQKH